MIWIICNNTVNSFYPSEPNATKKVTIENAAEADRTIAMLMGDDVAPRREFIEQNATYANIDA